jgi:hypothetical protein
VSQVRTTQRRDSLWGADLPELEADTTGEHVSFDTAVRTEICATLLVDFDDVPACGVPQRIPGIGEPDISFQERRLLQVLCLLAKPL